MHLNPESELSASRCLELNNQKIQNMIETLVHVIKENDIDIADTIMLLDQQNQLTDKLSVLIRKTALLLFQSNSHKRQPKPIAKQIPLNIPRSPPKHSSSNNPDNQDIVNKLLQSVQDIFEIYNILVKVERQNNMTMRHKCFEQLENTLKCIQSSLITYKTTNDTLTKTITAMAREKLISTASYIQPLKGNTRLGSQINQIQNRSEFNGQQSDKSTLMIEDLKDEINLLNHALQNNDKNYEFQIHKYQQKLLALADTVRELKEILWENQRVYQKQTEVLETQIYQYKLLVRNMARKIRNIQSNSVSFGEGSWEISRNSRQQFRDRDMLRQERTGSREHISSRLSRQRQGNISRQRQRLSRRHVNLMGFRRSISRDNNFLRNSNSSSKKKLI